MLFTFGRANRAVILRELGARLKTRRTELGLEQVQVMARAAASAGRNGQEFKTPGRSTLAQYENGTSMPGLDMIIALADALETTPWWISFGLDSAGNLPPPQPHDAPSDAGAAGPIYWEADERADGIDGPALALIDAGENAADAASGGTLYLFDRSAIPSATPENFVAVQGDDVKVVRAIRAGDHVLLDQGTDLWRVCQAEQVALLGRLVERLEGRRL